LNYPLTKVLGDIGFIRHPLSPAEVLGIMMMLSCDGSESYEDFIKILLRYEPDEETLTSCWATLWGQVVE
jgi:hypothetical protein